MEDNKPKREGTKRLLASGVVIIVIIGKSIWPVETGSAQVPSLAPATEIVDSAAILREEANRKDSVNLAMSRQTLSLAKSLNKKTSIQRVNIEKPAVKPTVLISVPGAVFEPKLAVYKGYYIIDYDSLQKEIALYQLEELDTASPQPIEPKIKKATKWQRFKKLFKLKKHE